MADILCKCPKCGGNIFENEKNFGCGNWKAEDGGCTVTIWKNQFEKLGKKAISKVEAKQLFTNGKTSKKVTLHSTKTDKDFDAFLVLDEEYKLQLAFD
ncbi:topoisomerase C-terminal repeat-containing protein [Cytobacillus sp. FJAT-54145]|uniref:Topoisomerase C-terminal repeat-containing protein n=1 Tax=Cytobacillus spartinae TaxID=3299023 RepID=A0ABW6KEN6_9BACI